MSVRGRQGIAWSFSLIIFFNILQAMPGVDIMDSGGPLSPYQAVYDVHYYRLAVQVFPEQRRIAGDVIIRATMVHPYDWLVVNLDTVFTVKGVQCTTAQEEWHSTPFHRREGEVWIYLNRTYQPGESLTVQIAYEGSPRVAQQPPWRGGFTWATTASGAPWIATSCQGEGVDIWWPVKDHVSDKPDSMDILVRVPDSLFVASNGRFIQKISHEDGTSTFYWHVSTPISTYNVALAIAPYQQLDSAYVSVSGDTVPVVFWVLPEYNKQGRAFLAEIVRQVHFFEQLLGPYPFRIDKLGVVQTPYLGMEHQTIIAYGANFDPTVLTEKDWGFDALLHHEMSHEWWGNLVTNFDWKDMWLHEGFGTYMQALFVEHLHGQSAYEAYMSQLRRFRNTLPVAPQTTQSVDQIYRAPIYYKGAWVLHTLRFLLGDSLFFLALRRMAYPAPQWEQWKDGRQCRFVTTDDFLQLVNNLSGNSWEWFFKAYLRHSGIPLLKLKWRGNKLFLEWQVPGGGLFPMPLEVFINGKAQKIEFQNNRSTISIAAKDTISIDPHQRVLFAFWGINKAREWIVQEKWDSARMALKPLLRIKNVRPQAIVLLRHITFRKNTLSKLNNDWYQSLLGKYRVHNELVLNVFKLQDRFMIQTNRRTFEEVLPISATEFWEVKGRYRYRFYSGEGETVVLEKQQPDGTVLFRARAILGDK